MKALRHLLERITPELPTPPPPPPIELEAPPASERRNNILVDAWQRRLEQQADQLAADLADLHVELALETVGG